MNVVQQPLDEQSIVLKIQVEENDYKDNVKKALNTYRKQANINGFRPGMAPMSLIEKTYGRSALLDEINKIVSNALSNHITENKLDILGEAIPYEEGQEPIDWDNQKDFEFNYEVGLAPAVELKLSKRDKLPYYVIGVTDEDKQRQLENLQQRYGNFSDAEISADDDLLKVSLSQEGENAVNVDETYISIKVVTDKKAKKQLIGLKVGDKFELDVKKTFTNEADLAAMLKVKKEQLENIAPIFSVEVKEVRHFNKAEINQELFDKAYGEGVVKNEEELKQRIEEEIRGSYTEESQYKLTIDAREKLTAKADIKLPEAFLKRWLLIANEGKVTHEQVEQEFDHFANDLRWQLIKDTIAKEQHIKVEEADLMAQAKRMARYQFMQYGLNNLPDEHLESFARRILEDKQQAKGIVERVYESKIVDYIKEAVKLEEKELSIEEFGKLFEKN